MEGRYPRGVLVALANCKDPAREEEFNRWYDQVHLGDVTGFGVFANPSRYVNVQPQPGQPKYAAIYETDQEDLKGAIRALFAKAREWEEQGRMIDVLEVASIGLYERIGEWCSQRGKPVRGLLMVISNCKDPAREEEFNRWYNQVHVPDILELGHYHTAYRYQSIAPDKTPGKYLALYETDEDPVVASQANVDMRPQWQARGRWTDLLETRLRLVMRRLTPS